MKFVTNALFCLIFIVVNSVTPQALQAQENEVSSESILYTAFNGDDYTYSITSIMLDGTNPTPLIQSNSGWFRPSPNGEKIALLQHRSGSLMEGEYDIYLLNLDGSELRQLTDTNHNTQPTWSPNGDKVAYLSGQYDNLDIYLFDLADINFSQGEVITPLQLTNLEGSVTSLEWSSNGQQLVFTLCDENFLCDIYLLNIDDMNLENLTDDFVDTVSSVSWSLNNEQFAFIAYATDYQSADLYTFNFESDTISKLSQTSADYSFLEWSHDSTLLAYTSNQAGTWDIFLLNLTTSEHTNLTLESELQDGFYGLSWSPDGEQIVFSAGPSEGDFDIFVMNKDGSDIYQLTDNEVHDTNPVWITNFSGTERD